MAVLPPGKGSQRRPSFRGNILQDTTRGVERTRIWPEPKGSRQTKGQLDQQEWFRQVNWAFKYMAAPVQAAFRKATQDTALYPRDLLSMIASGSFLAFKVDDERIAYPMAYMQAVSESLDTITAVPGSTLVRGPTFWTAQPPIPNTGVLWQRVERTANLNAATGTNVIPWQTAPINELAMWNAAQPSRLTVQPGITRLEIFGSIGATNGSVSGTQLGIRKNGSVIAYSTTAAWTANSQEQVFSGPLDVVPGDYFELEYTFQNFASKVILPNRTFLSARFG